MSASVAAEELRDAAGRRVLIEALPYAGNMLLLNLLRDIKGGFAKARVDRIRHGPRQIKNLPDTRRFHPCDPPESHIYDSALSRHSPFLSGPSFLGLAVRSVEM